MVFVLILFLYIMQIFLYGERERERAGKENVWGSEEEGSLVCVFVCEIERERQPQRNAYPTSDETFIFQTEGGECILQHGNILKRQAIMSRRC
jgi:hypothetical protein